MVGVLLLLGVAVVLASSGKIVDGKWGKWAQTHLTHSNPSITILYMPKAKDVAGMSVTEVTHAPAAADDRA